MKRDSHLPFWPARMKQKGHKQGREAQDRPRITTMASSGDGRSQQVASQTQTPSGSGTGLPGF